MSNPYQSIYEYKEKRKSAIIFLSIAVALFLAFIGFFTWNTVRMRNYELNYDKIKGSVAGVKESSSVHGRAHRTYYYLVISYTFNGQEYQFTDITGHRYLTQSMIDNPVEIYVDPQNPNKAEVLTSSDFASIICACFFAFFCVAYSVGMNLLLSSKCSSFKKRCLFVWGIEVLLGTVFLLLFWLGLPHSGFGEVFVRIEGAVGVTVVTGIVLCVALIDGLLTKKFKIKIYYHS